MKNIGWVTGTLLGTLLAVAFPAAAQLPGITAGGVRNSASYAAPGLPNSGIAQGSIFSIFGNNLGPDAAEYGFNFPLPTLTPGGKVSVAVTVNGTTTQAIVLYSGKTQINAVLPSNTPAGSGTLTVTVNGQTSAAAPIEVTVGDFGIYTINSAGSGPGIVTYADYSLVSVNNAANPGEALILWGTGLGPVSGSEADGALPGDQPGLPAEVYVGGMQASLLYRGRSGCCAGLDQIVFTVPSGVAGCAVPIAVRTGDKVGNFSTMSVAATGRACTDTASGLTSADFLKFLSNPSFTTGYIGLSRTASSTGTTDSGTAAFQRLPASSFSPGLFNAVSLGGCTVTSSAVPGAAGLDAGPAIAISGPGGVRMLTPNAMAGKGFYANAKLGDGTPGNFLDPGQYTSSSPGGIDVSSFNARSTIPAPLVWTNQSAIDTVNPSAGQSITWSGGDPGSYVAIDGGSSNATPGASFHCQARVSDGSFTIPPAVLLSLPSGAGSLSVGAATTTTFQTPGLDLGVTTASSLSSKNVTYGAVAQNGAPVANAGPNQVVSVGAAVQLNGSASSDPGGSPLTYQWSLASVPAGSAAVLSNAAIVNPAFTADRPGTYVAQLIVNNGKVNSAPATVTITTNSPQAPTANAGPNQTAALNATVTLSGSGTDPQGFPLTLHWTLITKPAGSAAALSSATAPNPTFVADKPGTFVAQLIVNNGFADSAPSTVTIAINGNAVPVANAGPNQNVLVGATVTLDGSGSASSNASSNKAPLTYAFTFVSRPAGSAAVLANANSAAPTFVADVAGTYVVQLIVNDGVQNSLPATVTITAAAAGAAASIAASGGTPQNAQINTLFASPLTAIVKDNNGNPVRGVTVTFTAPSTGPGGSFAGGVNTAVTNASGVAMSPLFTANGTAGTYLVTASAPGVAAPASFSLTNAVGRPSSLAATGGTPQSAPVGTAFAAPLAVTVKDMNGNPVSGVTVTFTPPGSGASGSFAGGANTAVTNASGVAASAVFTANATIGSYTVAATIPRGAAPANFSLTNSALSGTGITLSGASVGQNLQTGVTITLAQPAGSGGVQVTLTSSDPSKAVLAARSSDAGQGSLTVPIGAGQTTATIFVQGLVSSGTVNLMATAPNIGSGAGAVNLTPSGFILSGPAGNASISTGVGANTTLTVTSARLDSSMHFIEAQPLRAGTSASVTVASSSPSVGTVAPASVAFTGGQGGTATTQFTGVAAGTTTLTAAPPAAPAGFSMPAGGANVLTANVGSGGLTAASTAAGQNLEAAASVALSSPAPNGGVTVTLTSSDPSKLLLATAPDAAGSGSATLTVAGGTSRTPNFYVQALAGSGSVTYSATAPGLGSSTATVMLTPSGIIVSGPADPAARSFFTGTRSGASPITVSTVEVDPSGTFNIQPVRGGASVTITVTSSNPSAGTIASSPVTIGGGASSAATSFQPIGMGSTAISASVPAGFTAVPPYGTVTANVRMTGLTVTDQVVAGMNLQVGGLVVLGQAAPAGGVSVTLTSNDPKLLLSTSPTAAGSGSITVMVPASSNNAPYYLQALSSSGSGTYTAAASGYGTSTGTISYAPSGVVLQGPFGFNRPISTTATSAPTAIGVYTAVLDGTGNYIATQPLAGGLTITASLTSSAPAVGPCRLR